jgi:hypothetical protein
MQSTFLTANAPRVSAEAFDNEVMIVNLETGNYYSLTGVGATVWQLIEQGCTQSTLCENVQAAYGGDPAAIRAALSAFTDELRDEKLVVDQPGEPPSTALAEPLTAAAEFTPPVLEKYTDMQDLLLIDPIHEVNDAHGWPKMKS